jgi:hypothetical protein
MYFSLVKGSAYVMRLALMAALMLVLKRTATENGQVLPEVLQLALPVVLRQQEQKVSVKSFRTGSRIGWGPRTIFNGNYVSTATHALPDPYRYRFMPRAWKEANAPMNRAMAQWTRFPNVYKGTAAGGAYGAAGAAQAGCECRPR